MAARFRRRTGLRKGQFHGVRTVAGVCSGDVRNTLATPGGDHVIVRARAPLRLGLAGGGTDVSPYCDVHGGCVLNTTIDRYAYAVLKTLDEPLARFIASDQRVVDEMPIAVPLQLDGKLDLHKAVYNHMIQYYNGGKPIALELSTFCDAPPGSG